MSIIEFMMCPTKQNQSDNDNRERWWWRVSDDDDDVVVEYGRNGRILRRISACMWKCNISGLTQEIRFSSHFTLLTYENKLENWEGGEDGETE